MALMICVMPTNQEIEIKRIAHSKLATTRGSRQTRNVVCNNGIEKKKKRREDRARYISTASPIATYFLSQEVPAFEIEIRQIHTRLSKYGRFTLGFRSSADSHSAFVSTLVSTQIYNLTVTVYLAKCDRLSQSCAGGHRHFGCHSPPPRHTVRTSNTISCTVSYTKNELNVPHTRAGKG